MPGILHKVTRILLLSLLLSACGSFQPPGERQTLLIYSVRPGDTLYSIAWRYGYDYREVAAWNDIDAPYSIFVGQKLKIIAPYQRKVEPPKVVAVAPAATPKPMVTTNSHKSVKDNKPTASSTKRPVGVEKPPARTKSIKVSWRWPTTGKVTTRFNPGEGKKGLDITGKRGQAVVAAASGEVVYSGEGLIGYGKLVIIKHDSTYLSAYGHNDRLLVKEGQKVAQGARIADMGGTRKEGSILHFEIRRDGKPVDPLHYLPR